MDGMAELKPRTPLPGSERAPFPGARISGKVDLTETVHVTVVLRPTPASSGKKAAALKVVGARLPNDRPYPTREEFAADYGATAEEFAKVEAFTA